MARKHNGSDARIEWDTNVVDSFLGRSFNIWGLGTTLAMVRTFSNSVSMVLVVCLPANPGDLKEIQIVILLVGAELSVRRCRKLVQYVRDRDRFLYRMFLCYDMEVSFFSADWRSVDRVLEIESDHR